MTSSNRIKTTIQHREPDRVPMHINASKWVVRRLMDKLELDTPKDLLNHLQIDVYDMRGVDLHSGTVPAFNGPSHPILKAGKEWGGNIMALWNIQEYQKESSHGPVLEIEPPPLYNKEDLEDWANYPWPDVNWFDFSELKEDLKEWEEFSIMASGGSVFQHASYLRGLDKQLIDMMMMPEASDYLHDKLCDFYYEYYHRLLTAGESSIDILAFADDFGTQNSLMIGPDQFDQHFANRIKRMADLAHKFDAAFLLHTCGDVEPLIPRFIELGVDVLDPIQPESMDPARIKKIFGKDICLRGGISSQQVLAHGNPEDVISEVRNKLDILMPDGGYIFSPGHPVLQVDIPTENIIAMYQTAYKYGRY